MVNREQSRAIEQSTQLCDEHGWLWYSDFDIEGLAYRFVAIPHAAFQMYTKMIGTGSDILSTNYRNMVNAWVRENGVDLSVTDDGEQDPITAGHRKMRLLIEAKIAQRPLLSSKNRLPPLKETRD